MSLSEGILKRVMRRIGDMVTWVGRGDERGFEGPSGKGCGMIR